jgi:hypothetical protein
VILLGAFAAGLLLALSACGGGATANKRAAVTAEASKTTATQPHTTATYSQTTGTQSQKTGTQPQTTGTQRTTPSQIPGTPTVSTAPASSTATVKAPALPAAECRRLGVLAARMGQAFTGRTPAADTRAYASALQQLAKTAPTDMRDDIGVLADAYAKIASAVAVVYTGHRATPTPDQLKQLADVGKELNTGAIDQAATTVNVWLQRNCVR